MDTVLVVVTGKGQFEAISSAVDLQGAHIEVLAIGQEELTGDSCGSASRLVWVDTSGKPAELFADLAAEEIRKVEPAVVLGVAIPGVRAVMGSAAYNMAAPSISNVVSFSIDGSSVYVDRSVFDDRLIESLDVPAPAFLLLNELSLPVQKQASSASANELSAVRVDGAAQSGIEIVGVEPIEKTALQGADYVVGVGRGVKDQDGLAKAEELADVLGAEIGCTMPVAKDLGLVPHERYIGISGRRISPKVYFACGIAGYAQHVYGVKDADVIVVINNDPKALFFDHSDYGIVGDLNEILPELAKALA